MRIIYWAIWLAFLIGGCSATVSLPMVLADLQAQNDSVGFGAIGAILTATFGALSLYIRFRTIPRLLNRSVKEGSPRVLLNLAASWFLAFWMLVGAYGIARASGDVIHGFLVGVVTLAVLFVEMPWFRSFRSRTDAK